ncbi:B- and T-lymphocyte attenuator-like isoform X2 [Sardina pilchardus]|uniref:B- and T-lymphocyte attenuator-like isoform X2 n=1 Tax=Sardina pilchardus TaxID=27697 RepID=UPI002E12299B
MALRNVHFFTLSQLLIQSASLFSPHAQGVKTNDSCSIQVLLKRNSRDEAFSTESLTINCPIAFCDKRPDVGWCKLTDSNECAPVNDTDLMKIRWTNTNETYGILSLHFKHIVMDDSGLYRCRCKGNSMEHCMSHSMNVTVKDASNHETPDNSWHVWFWPTIYISSGITSVIIIVTVLICLGLRCRKGSQNASMTKADENQYDSVQMSDIGASLPGSSHHAQPKPRPRSHPTPVDAQRQGDGVYENGHGRGSQPTSNVSSGDVVAPQRYLTNHVVAQPRMLEEEANPLVYASLNHQVKPRPHTRPIQAPEESTEYAAIRIS